MQPKPKRSRKSQPRSDVAWSTPGPTVLPWGRPSLADRPPAVLPSALAADCACPADCLRDHANE